MATGLNPHYHVTDSIATLAIRARQSDARHTGRLMVDTGYRQGVSVRECYGPCVDRCPDGSHWERTQCGLSCVTCGALSETERAMRLARLS